MARMMRTDDRRRASGRRRQKAACPEGIRVDALCIV